MTITTIKPAHGSARCVASNSRRANIAGKHTSQQSGTPRYQRPAFYGGWSARVVHCNQAPSGLVINKPSRGEIQTKHGRYTPAPVSTESLLNNYTPAQLLAALRCKF